MISVIEARDLDEAWYLSVKECFGKNSKRYIIDKGSFEGHERFQIKSLALAVSHPETRPLAPSMPGGSSLDPPTSEDYIEQYFGEYIMNPDKAKNEDYSYGEFIYPHLDNIVELLQHNPLTNQAVINIGESFGYSLGCSYDLIFPEWDCIDKKPKTYENPPCLRCITWQYNDDELEIHTFWRSWSIYSGMPTNLGGMQLLNEYIADCCGYKTGAMYAYSSGAHVYDYEVDFANARLGVKK